MSQSLTVDMMKRMLDRLPGVVFCTRMDPAKRESTWLYLSDRAGELYDVDQDRLRADPYTCRENLLPEDLARLEAQVAESILTGTPMVFVGRNRRRSGEIRWLETHANVEREADGTVLWYGQALDVTCRVRLEQSLAESEAAKAKSEALYRRVIDALPVGVMVTNQALEFEIWNPVMERLTGGIREHRGDLMDIYGIFMADGVTPLSMERSGTARGLRGETVEEEVVIKNPRLGAPVRTRATFTPLLDDAGKVFATLGTSLDITLQRELETELRTRNEELARSEEAKAVLIDRLRYSIGELSNPILEVWDGVLVMPVIGMVDSERTADMVHRLLAEVTRMQAGFVIIDLTGVEIVDTHTADHLMKLVRKVEIVGARCVLTGVRAGVAQTLVDLGVDFGHLVTLRNLKHGLREALRVARREQEELRDVAVDDGGSTRRSAERSPQTPVDDHPGAERQKRRP